MTKFTRFKMLLMALVMLVGSGNVFAAVGDVVYTLPGGTGQPFGTSNTYALKTGTYNSVSWTATLGSCQSATVFWLGSNSSQKAKLTLGATYAAVGTPCGIAAADTYVCALIAGSEFNNVGKVTVANTSIAGNATTPTVYVVYSTNSGSSYSLAAAAQTAASAGTLTFEFTTIPSARYAIVVKGINDYTIRVPVVTFYEGVTSGPQVAVTPTFSPVAGTYYSDQNVTISTETPDATIRYTTNGNDPDETSTIYTTPITVSATTTIKAKAFKTDMTPSEVATATYTIIKTPTILVAESSIPTMSAFVNNTDVENITINASNLIGNITLEVTGTNASLFKLSTSSISPTSGSVTNQSVSITYTPDAPGSHSATLVLSSEGATNVERSLSGTANWAPLAAPEAKTASGSNTGGFTANWTEVNGATEYQLNVYSKVGETEFFDLAPASPTDWSFTGISSYTSSSTGYFGLSAPSVKFDGTGDVVITPNYSNLPNKVSFWMRGASTDANSALLFEGYNGSEWTTIENIKPLPTTATTKIYDQSSSPVLSSGFIQFRFTYTKSAGNLAFDDFAAVNVTQIAGSPFTIVNDTVKAITGLNSGTTYYYTVVAKNTNVTSVTSNEIAASTLSTSISIPASISNITAFDGKIRFSANAGQQVEVYNAVGQKLISAITLDGLNTLSVNAKGMMIVKVGDRLAKVIL
ncbi:MAG: chitobiase/beta-hexosaminidase C-terminal domain-containing protein [Paludibacter sp.]|nr:chitobiase/beta-hexosaminidase C-terminal domain-containing protein [Paludibacter sp.]